MITVQQSASNFFDNATGQLLPQPAEFPNSLNGQTFSIENPGFTFQVEVNVTGLADGETVSFGLIQIISASVRVMGNASNGAKITLANYPMLDGDVADTLWYNQGTASAVDVGNGLATVSLGDNPSTNCDVCSGISCVNVNETFVIVLAQLLNNQYVPLAQWTWGYACAATRLPNSPWVDANGLPVTNVQTTFGVDPQQPGLNFDPQVRANQQTVTVTGCASCVCPP